MDSTIFLQCEDSIEGIFTAIYEGFVIKKKLEEPYHDNIEIQIGEGNSVPLFSESVEIVTDLEKAEKTAGAIQRKLGWHIYEKVLSALCHFSEDRATIVFGYLVRAFPMGMRIEEHLADPFVQKTSELSRKVYNETDKFRGFVRFSDWGRYLMSEIEPKCNVMPFLYGFFADRFPSENFIIYDHKHSISYVHKAYTGGTFLAGVSLHGYQNQTEDDIENLWKQYIHSMAIKERKNERCQNTLMPKWYRKNMPEFV